LIAAISTIASGCDGSNGAVLAKQACEYVSSSISLFESSLTTKDKGTQNHLQDQAYDEMQLALQPAALAAGDNGQWQALSTTISESSRVPEGALVSALQQQCAVADSQGGAPPPAATTPGT
jgi:hypothetical protein